MRLIDADKRIARYCEENCGCTRQECTLTYEHDGCEACTFVQEIEDEPSVDAEPVQSGHWEWRETWLDESPEYPCELLKEGWACSACGVYLMQYLKSHFHDIESYAECISDEMPTIERCPHCGAKMKGSEQDAAD